MNMVDLGTALLVALLTACPGADTRPAKAPVSGAAGAAQAAPAGQDPAEKGPSPAGARAESGPLAPLVPVVAHLNEGIRGVLAGAAPGELAAAFAPWTFDTSDPERLASVRADLQAAGVASAAHVSMELELVFAADGRDVYYLRTGVFGTDARVGFLSFAGRVPEGGKVGVEARPLAEFGGPAQPFRDAAEGLLAVFRDPACASELPLADPAEVSRLVTSEAARRGLLAGLDEARTNIQKECAALAALAPDQVRLRLDDQAFAALGADGGMKGILKGSFSYADGQLVYELRRLQRAPG